MARVVAFLGEVEEDPAVLGPDALPRVLSRSLEVLNQEHAAAFLAPLASPGVSGEFVGILRDLGPVYDLWRGLAEALHPLPVRVGVSRGELALPFPVPGAEELDGPVLDAAAELLYRARKEDRLLLVQGGAPAVDALANALFQMLSRDLQGWTERQCEMVRLYRKLNRQLDVAEALGVSQQTVSRSLSGAGWPILEETEATLRRVLHTYPEPPGRVAGGTPA